MARQQTAAADTEFRVGFRSQHPLDHFHPRPDTAGILPAPARTTEPLAQNRASSHQAPFILFERPRERAHLAGGAHGNRDDGSQQVGRNRQAGALRDSPHVGDDLQTVARHSSQRSQNIGEGLPRSFQSWRNDAGGDDSGFEQPQVIAREVENLGQGSDVGAGMQVHAGQAKHRLVDRPEVYIDGRLRARRAGAAQRQIDGDIENPRAFRVIHAEEKDIAPATVAEVHADRGRFAQDRERAAPARTVEQFGPQNQRVIGRMSDAGHPLVAAHGTHAAANLGRQRLEGEPLISRGQSARQSGGRARGRERQQRVNGFVKTALENVRQHFRRHGFPGRHAGFVRQMETVNRVQKKMRPHPLVQVVAFAAELIQRCGFRHQLRRAGPLAKAIERPVPALAGSGRDDADQLAHCGFEPAGSSIARVANSSSRLASTCSRSWPVKASAIWAVRRPYRSPTSYLRLRSSNARYCSRRAS